MSQENVEIVQSVVLFGAEDYVLLFRDDDRWEDWLETNSRFFHQNFAGSSAARGIEPGLESWSGLDGYRAGWLDWLAPWAAFRFELADVRDCGDRVLVLGTLHGRLEGSSTEVTLAAGCVWTLRDGKIIRFEGYTTPTEALKAVGLEG
jgi:ketosteroid isomerase-like protein